MRQRLLLLPCDEGGTPHGAAVAVPEPAHRGWRRVGGTSKAMVRLGLCSERRGWTPHHHGDKKLVSKCCFFCFGGFLSLYFPKAPNMTRDPLVAPSWAHRKPSEEHKQPLSCGLCFPLAIFSYEYEEFPPSNNTKDPSGKESIYNKKRKEKKQQQDGK